MRLQKPFDAGIAEAQSIQSSKRSGSLTLIIIPVAVVLLPILFRGVLGPFYAAPNTDPVYNYLLNVAAVRSFGSRPR
jgi:hypothetical protein